MLLPNRISIAFILVCGCAGMAEVAADSRYFEFPSALPGKILKATKELNTTNGKMQFKSNLPEVSTVEDLLALEAIELAVLKSKYGALEPRLAHRFETMGINETVKVGIRLKMIEVPYLDKTAHSLEELMRNAQSRISAGPVSSMPVVLERNGIQGFGIPGMSMITLPAGKAALASLKTDPDIAAIWEVKEEETLAAREFSTLAYSAYNPGPVPSGSGAGVRAATFEYGLTSAFLTCIGVTPTSYEAWTSADGDALRHTEAVFRSMVHAAPSASSYHRKSVTYNGTSDINYIVNNGIQTVSLSKARGGTSPYRSTYSEFLTMDNFAYTYPYPVFVNPAGNSGYQYEVNWQGYNSISVGNVRHTNQSTYEMADCTQIKNPPPVYGSCISGSGSDCAGDREMPHVVVPGYPDSGTTFSLSCLDGWGSLGCGTSFSAAVGNGIAATVISADSRMVSWPEKVRATLILTAQNVESGDWSVSGDERDGTGVISGSEAVSFAQNHTSVSQNNAAVASGMYAGSLYATDFGSNKRFNFLVPNPKPSGKHLRVVLTWDSNPDVNAGTNSLSDLDLIVQHNSGTNYSSSWDSNVEVVDIPAANLTAGSSYYIDVSPYMSRIPSTGTNYFYYAVAWTWVKDHAP